MSLPEAADEAHLPLAVVDLQIPGGAGQGQERVAQQDRAEPVVSRRQRQGQQIGGLLIAQPVAGTQDEVPEGIPDGGASVPGTSTSTTCSNRSCWAAVGASSTRV
ncbi:hypothetical protein GY15_13560 [Delftia sp. 670]|nr:hypothetical protein GY15_13560 [Delftia sp. 670]